MNRTREFLGVAGILLLCTAGFGQPHSPRDSIWWNPANWVISRVATGMDTASSWSLVNGVPENRVDSLLWSSGRVFPVPGARNETPTSQTVWMTSVGQSEYTIRWIGIGPAPARVLLRIGSYPWAGVFTSGEWSISLDNGLGTLNMMDYNADPQVFTTARTMFDSVLRYVDVGAAGTASFIINSSAESRATSLDSRAHADAHDGGAVVADRVVAVLGDPGPTYHREFPDGPVANEQRDAQFLVMDVGIRYNDGSSGGPPPPPVPGSGEVYAKFYGLLWGAWVDPIVTWSWDDIGGDPRNAYLSRTYSGDQIEALISNGPQELTNRVRVRDADRIVSEAEVNVRVHAPWEHPHWTYQFEDTDDFVRVSPWVVRSPYGPSVLTESIAYSTAITKNLTVGSGGDKFNGGHPLVRALSLSFQYGVTATVTTTQSYSTTVSQGPANVEVCIEKQNLWLVKQGHCATYGPSGYAGLAGMSATLWQSGSKETAEKNDHRYRTRSRAYHG